LPRAGFLVMVDSFILQGLSSDRIIRRLANAIECHDL
jgi:hypothetical protein